MAIYNELLCDLCLVTLRFIISYSVSKQLYINLQINARFSIVKLSKKQENLSQIPEIVNKYCPQDYTTVVCPLSFQPFIFPKLER